MKINKEKEVNTEIHKKRTGKIHKKNETKIDNKSMTTRAGRSVTSVGKMAESADKARFLSRRCAYEGYGAGTGRFSLDCKIPVEER